MGILTLQIEYTLEAELVVAREMGVQPDFTCSIASDVVVQSKRI